VSQITLIKTHKPDNTSSLVGREAKNPLPNKERENYSLHDVAGLSWIFLDEPLSMEDFA
jgi:hypothetical protein